MRVRLDDAQRDRAIGVLVGAACGDALGAGYEFESAPLVGRPQMIGGGLGDFAPGEWTDDTAQTYAIAEVAAARAQSSSRAASGDTPDAGTGIAGTADLRDPAALDRIAQRFADWWAGSPPDVGILTRQVLGAGGRHPSAARLRQIAAELHAGGTRTAGNGTLMRTAPVALAHLHDPDTLVEAAAAVAALTHADPLGGEACALWCLGIRHAVLTGELPPLAALTDALPTERRAFWVDVIAAAETTDPGTFNPNGYVVTALQAAWAAIVHTCDARDDSGRQLVDGLAAAIAIGNDTDTIASIAGAMLGARWGLSAIPQEWTGLVHGWPGATLPDLAELAVQIVGGSPGGR